MKTLSWTTAVFALCFALGLSIGHARAESDDALPKMDMVPQTNDELMVPPETIPGDPEEGLQLQLLIERAETVAEELLVVWL